MVSASPSSRGSAKKGPPAWYEQGKFAMRIVLIVGAVAALAGVSLFTYSEAYPSDRKVGPLTTSQLGFWLIFSGAVLMLISVLVSQFLSYVGRKSIPPPTAVVTSGTGLGYEDDNQDEESSALLGSGLSAATSSSARRPPRLGDYSIATPSTKGGR